jgi:hypothetical protein
MSYTKLQLEITIEEEDKSINIKINGFDTFEEIDEYGEFLMKNIRLMLFNSEVIH